MGKQTIRQRARQAARDTALRRRREREGSERRLTHLAEQVLVALAERDAAVADAERRAGVALRELTDVEGLSLREAVEWCGGQVSVREATRLRRQAAQDADEGADRSVVQDGDRPGAAPGSSSTVGAGGDGGGRAGQATG
jgi:hypothetical protein